jgi:hypothetical protein
MISANLDSLRSILPFLRVAGAVSLFVLGGCVGPHLKVPVKEVNRRVKTLCVAPLKLDFELKGGRDRVQAYETILLQELHRTKWEIVLPARYDAIARRITEQEGGYYDPLTGQADEARRLHIAEQIRSTVRRELGCEATLHPTIAVVGAGFYEGSAVWDDTHQYLGIYWHARDGGIPVLSLWVSIRDELDQELYFGTGGIHLLLGAERAGFSKMRVYQVAEEYLLTDVRRTYDSVRDAIEPFLKAGPSVGVSRYAEKLGAARSAELPASEADQRTNATGTP